MHMSSGQVKSRCPVSVAVIARNFMAGMTAIISPSRQTYDTLMKYKVKAPIEIIPTGVNTSFNVFVVLFFSS